MRTHLSVKECNNTLILQQKDKFIYEKAFMLADREWNVPNTQHIIKDRFYYPTIY